MSIKDFAFEHNLSNFSLNKYFTIFSYTSLQERALRYFFILKRIQMAKSKKQRRIEAKDRKASKTILTVIVVATIAILVFMYLVFQST